MLRKRAPVLLLLIGLAAVWWWFAAQDAPVAAGAAASGGVEPAVELGTITSAAGAPEAAALLRNDAMATAGTVPADAAPAAEPTATGIRFLGRCVAAEDGTPLAGVRVRLSGSVGNDRLAKELGQEQWEPPPPLETGVDGRFEFRLPHLPAHQFFMDLQRADRVMRTDRWSPGFAAGAVVDLGEVPMARGQRLRGRAQDADGRPVGAIVSLRGLPMPLRPDGGGGETLSARTNADGSFEFASAVPPGEWPVFAEGEGWMREHPSVVHVAQWEPPPPLIVTMRALVSIEGRVLDESGAPVARAYVSVREPRGNYGETDWSDAEGRFVIHQRNRNDAPVSLRVEADGFREQEFPSMLDWGAREVVLNISRGSAVTLHVIERESGAPVTRFGVRSADGPAGARLGGLRLDGEHPQGVLTVKELQRGLNQLRVVPTDLDLLPSAVLEVDASAPVTEPRVVEVERLQAFEVVVRFRDGSPAAGSQLRIFDRALQHEHAWEDLRNSNREIYSNVPLALLMAEAVAGADGRARLFAPAGAAEVFLDARGPHLPSTHALVRPLAQPPPIEILVARGAVLRGTVRMPAAGAGTYGVILRFLKPDGAELGVPGKTQPEALPADGSFSFTALDAGNYRLYLGTRMRFKSPDGGSRSSWQPLDAPLADVVLGPDEVRVLELDAALAECAVTAQCFLDGAPLAQRPIALSRASRDSGHPTWISYGSFLTDAAGRAQADGLLPGEYVATALIESADGGTRELVARSAAQLVAGTVNACRFDFRARTIHIQAVADEDGRALAGWTCHLRATREAPLVLTPWDWDPAGLTTDAAGILRYDAPAAGEHVLHLRLGTESRTTQPFTIPEEPGAEPIVLRARLGE